MPALEVDKCKGANKPNTQQSQEKPSKLGQFITATTTAANKTALTASNTYHRAKTALGQGDDKLHNMGTLNATTKTADESKQLTQSIFRSTTTTYGTFNLEAESFDPTLKASRQP